MTFDTRAPLAIQSARTINVGRGSGGPGFTPIVAQNYLGFDVGQTSGVGWGFSEVVDTHSFFEGGKSARLGRNMAIGDPIDPENCGGFFYGNRRTLPELIPLGYCVWQRIRMYIPSAFSWGFAYGSNETDNPCGRSSDGTSNALKWLVFSPNVSDGIRIYLNLDPPRRQVAQKESPNIQVLIETGSQFDRTGNFVVPEDEWVSFQLGVKVSNTGDGWARVWVNDNLMCDLTDVNTVPANATGINEWGIGDYWNGAHWSDGEPGREHFYVDDIVVATDLPGYGAPLTTDSSGNRYITNTITSEDF